MRIQIIQYGGTQYTVNVESFEFRSNHCENWIRLKHKTGQTETVRGIATLIVKENDNADSNKFKQ